MFHLYIDESGNTGKIKFTNDWNFKEQPYFSLCGILCDDSNLDKINNDLKNLLKNYNIVSEIKSNSKLFIKNKYKIINDLHNLFNKYNCKIYLEIVNKKYKITNYIVDYCIFPYYHKIFNDSSLNEVKQQLSNYLLEILPESLLSEFVSIVENNNSTPDDLIQFCKKLLVKIPIDGIKVHISETIDDTLEIINGDLHINTLPIVDTIGTRNNSNTSISPNIESFTNILVRLIKDAFDEVSIIHDEQLQFEKSLTKYCNSVNGIYNSKFTIKFMDSKLVPLIQASDFLAGSIVQYLKNPHELDNLDSNLSLSFHNLIINNCNVVSNFSEQFQVFKNSYYNFNQKRLSD